MWQNSGDPELEAIRQKRLQQLMGQQGMPVRQKLVSECDTYLQGQTERVSAEQAQQQEEAKRQTDRIIALLCDLL